MKHVFFAAVLAAAPTTVGAEPSFRAEFHQELQKIGLPASSRMITFNPPKTS